MFIISIVTLLIVPFKKPILTPRDSGFQEKMGYCQILIKIGSTQILSNFTKVCKTWVEVFEEVAICLCMEGTSIKLCLYCF